MDIKTLCLGVLCMGEASGYEIKKFFEEGFSHFYVAGFGSIYPALAQLTRDGHVTCSNITQEKRPAKKVYRITESGRALFHTELAHTHPTHKVRSDFLLQMVFAPYLSPERLEEVLVLRCKDIQADLEHVQTCSRERALSAGSQFAVGYAQAVLQAGLDYISENREALLAELKQEE